MRQEQIAGYAPNAAISIQVGTMARQTISCLENATSRRIPKLPIAQLKLFLLTAVLLQLFRRNSNSPIVVTKLHVSQSVFHSNPGRDKQPPSSILSGATRTNSNMTHKERPEEIRRIDFRLRRRSRVTSTFYHSALDRIQVTGAQTEGVGARTQDLRLKRPLHDFGSNENTNTYDDQFSRASADDSSQSQVSPISADNTAQSDPRLADLIDAWNELPEAVRAGIHAMVNATLKQ